MTRKRILACLAVLGALGPWSSASAEATGEVPARLAPASHAAEPRLQLEERTGVEVATTPLAERTVDQVVIVKSSRRLFLYDGALLVESYPVALGFEPDGPKRVQGDGRTPEGAYHLDYRNKRSDYHRSIHVSYPDTRDRARARALGRSPGGMIMIHGLPTGLGDIGRDHTTVDWTDGCIAVTNEQMDEIWRLVDDGTPIHILP
jgi:murein L,D-transpeptidase YafK